MIAIEALHKIRRNLDAIERENNRGTANTKKYQDKLARRKELENTPPSVGVTTVHPLYESRAAEHWRQLYEQWERDDAQWSDDQREWTEAVDSLLKENELLIEATKIRLENKAFQAPSGADPIAFDKYVNELMAKQPHELKLIAHMCNNESGATALIRVGHERALPDLVEKVAQKFPAVSRRLAELTMFIDLSGELTKSKHVSVG